MDRFIVARFNHPPVVPTHFEEFDRNVVYQRSRNRPEADPAHAPSRRQTDAVAAENAIQGQWLSGLVGDCHGRRQAFGQSRPRRVQSVDRHKHRITFARDANGNDIGGRAYAARR